jgi:hypothetical protein
VPSKWKRKYSLVGLAVLFVALNYWWFFGDRDPRQFFVRNLRFEPPKAAHGKVVFCSQSNGLWIEPSLNLVDIRTHDQQSIAKSATTFIRISPDGNKIAYATHASLIVVDEEKHATTLDGCCGLPVWSPASDSIVCSHFGAPLSPNTPPKPAKGTWRYAADGSRKEKLAIPEDHFVWDWSPDGSWFLVSTNDFTHKFYLLSTQNSATPVPLNVKEPVYRPRFSRDGKRLFYISVPGDSTNKTFRSICTRELTMSSKEATLADAAERVYLADESFSICDFGSSSDGDMFAISTIDDRTVKPGKSSTGKLELFFLTDGRRTEINSNAPALFLAVDIW